MSAFDLPNPVHSVPGVTVGIVVDNKDPEGLGRVRVRFPSLSDSMLGTWARVASPMAGPQYGVVFLPEINDEVLVVFEAGDIRYPYVLGALWNVKQKPPVVNDNGQNNIRLIESRSGHKVRMDDTKGAEKIEIIDKSGKSSLTFDVAKKRITLHSEMDIVLDAPNGDIKLNAKTVHVAATGAASIKGKGGLTLDGSPGKSVLKGTTVDIN